MLNSLYHQGNVNYAILLLHFTPVRMAKIKANDRPSWQGGRERGILNSLLVRVQTGTSTMEINIEGFLKNLKIAEGHDGGYL